VTVDAATRGCPRPTPNAAPSPDHLATGRLTQPARQPSRVSSGSLFRSRKRRRLWAVLTKKAVTRLRFLEVRLRWEIGLPSRILASCEWGIRTRGVTIAHWLCPPSQVLCGSIDDPAEAAQPASCAVGLPMDWCPGVGQSGAALTGRCRSPTRGSSAETTLPSACSSSDSGPSRQVESGRCAPPICMRSTAHRGSRGQGVQRSGPRHPDNRPGPGCSGWRAADGCRRARFRAWRYWAGSQKGMARQESRPHK